LCELANISVQENQGAGREICIDVEYVVVEIAYVVQNTGPRKRNIERGRGEEMENIRKLTPGELDDALALSQFAFQYELSPQELEETKREMEANELQWWGCFDENRLAAKLGIIPFRTYLGGQLLDMGGIAGVATWPEFRRQGMVGKLLRRALTEMKDAGQTVSYLHPFSIAFYRRFGWEVHTSLKKYTLKVDQLPRFPKPKGKLTRLDLPGEWQTISQVYEAYASRFDGTLQRNKQWWKRRILKKKMFNILYTNTRGEPRGYFLYELKNDKMTIHEWAALDFEAWQGLWHCIRNHDSMLQEVHLQAPETDNLPFLLEDPLVQQRLEPLFISRNVDMESFLKQTVFKPQSAPVHLFLHVDDEHAPWNAGTFEFKLDERGERTVRLFRHDREQMSCAHPPKRGVMGNIRAFSSLFLGNQLPSALYDRQLLQGNGDDIKLLEQIVVKQDTYLMDFF
jgi:predicted acetyltransferase